MSIQLFVCSAYGLFPFDYLHQPWLTDAVSPFSFVILFILSKFCYFHLFKVCNNLIETMGV